MLPSSDDNPYFPLPRDYQELTLDGQSAARRNACCSWYDPDRPSDLISDPAAFVIGFNFWKEWYRKGWVGNKAKYSYQTPQMHRDWIKAFAGHPLGILTCFRDSGKTMVFGEEIPEFVITTRPHTPVQYTSSAEDLSDKQVRAVRYDLMTNELLIQDFGVQRPTKQSLRLWRGDSIELANGSSFYAISVDSRQRGTTQLSLRALLQILDDWEVDKRVKNAELRSDAEDFLFNVFFPCADPRARRFWTNTLLDMRSWAMRAAYKKDSRFANWWASQEYRHIWYQDPEGNWVSRWEDRFPVTMIRGMASEGGEAAVEGVVSLGQAAFATEFMNDPTSKKRAAFDFDPARHTYQWEGDEINPVLVLPRGEKLLLSELRRKSTLVTSLDASVGQSSDADLSAIVTAALDWKGRLIVLECWTSEEQREKINETLKRMLRQADYWRSKTLIFEKVCFEQLLIDQVQATLNQMNSVWSSNPEAYRPPPNLAVLVRQAGPSKPKRLLRLQYRFKEDLILFPLGGTLRTPYGQGSIELKEEIEAVRGDGTSFRWDDAVDAVEMCQEILMGETVPTEPAPPDPKEKIQQNFTKYGALPPGEIPGWLGLIERATLKPDVFGDPDEF